MSDNEIKPVAWMVDEQGMTGQLVTKLYWARNGGIPPSFGQNHSPLYDQSAIDRLTAERDAALAQLAECRADAERWRRGRDHGFPVFGYFGSPDERSEWGICVTAGVTHKGSTPEAAIDAAHKGVE